jgi:hypothetical protein
MISDFSLIRERRFRFTTPHLTHDCVSFPFYSMSTQMTAATSLTVRWTLTAGKRCAATDAFSVNPKAKLSSLIDSIISRARELISQRPYLAAVEGISLPVAAVSLLVHNSKPASPMRHYGPTKWTGNAAGTRACDVVGHDDVLMVIC